MRRRTEIEKIVDQPRAIRLEIVQVRSIFAPRWWEVRKIYRWLQLQHRVKRERKKLSMETQMALAWAEEALERELLYGKED